MSRPTRSSSLAAPAGFEWLSGDAEARHRAEATGDAIGREEARDPDELGGRPSEQSPPSSEVRLRALDQAEVLDTPPEAAFDRLTDVVPRVLGVPIALISFVGEHRQFFKSQQGLAEPWCSLRETPLSHSFCQHVVGQDAPLVIEDAREHPLVCDNPAIDELNVVAYLGVPIRTPEGVPIGSLCAIDTEARDWTERDLIVLETLATAASTELAMRYQLRQRQAAETALRTLNETLEERVHERTQRVQELSRALTLAEQRERVRIAQILHDDLQQVLVTAKMAGSFGDMERLGGALDEAIRVSRTLAQELSPALLRGDNLRELLLWLAERVREQHETSVEVEAARIRVPDVAVRVLLYQLVRELLFNVVKHAGTKRARISAKVVDGYVCLVVRDKGVGFDPSTLADKGGTGLGLSSAQERLELIGGRLTIESAPGEGTSVELYAPLSSEVR